MLNGQLEGELRQLNQHHTIALKEIIVLKREARQQKGRR